MIDLEEPIDLKSVLESKKIDSATAVKQLVEFEAGSLNDCLSKIAKNIEELDWQLFLNISKVLMNASSSVGAG